MNRTLEAALHGREINTPCLVLDIPRVGANYRNFAHAMDGMDVYYAVKANPHPAILQCLADAGCNFDCASREEVEMVLRTGAGAQQISFGSTMKKAKDIAETFALGVRLYAFDAEEEVHKLAANAPGADVFCRILTNPDGAGALWPLTRKFGCDDEMAISLLELAKELGLNPRGVSFHVGSQQTNMAAWDAAIRQAFGIFEELDTKGIGLDLVNIGGGFPTDFGDGETPSFHEYGASINDGLMHYFGDRKLRIIAEPGRAIVGDAGIIASEVVLVSRKARHDSYRWVYIDIGKYHGLAETEDEAIRYHVNAPMVSGDLSPTILAGPTCDSVDTMYEKTPVPLPEGLKAGDMVYLHDTGAYTSTYSSVGFNGFPPLDVKLLDEILGENLRKYP